MVISYQSEIDRIVFDWLSMPKERLLNLIMIEMIPKMGVGYLDIGFWYESLMQAVKQEK